VEEGRGTIEVPPLKLPRTEASYTMVFGSYMYVGKFADKMVKTTSPPKYNPKSCIANCKAPAGHIHMYTQCTW